MISQVGMFNAVRITNSIHQEIVIEEYQFVLFSQVGMFNVVRITNSIKCYEI